MGIAKKISIPKKKKRIPLPGKPPKIEKSDKEYERNKEKRLFKKSLRE